MIVLLINAPIKVPIFSLLLYCILENDNPVGDGDTISGLENGELDSNVQWTLQYEDSLVQPVRAVLDVNMGEYASGIR